jgi:hypothetical protein
MRRLLCLTTLVIALAAPAPAAANEPDDSWVALLRYSGEFAGFRIAAPSPPAFQDRITLGHQAQPSPDLTIANPAEVPLPPLPCVQADPTTIRCPIDGLVRVTLETGAGDDQVFARGVSVSPSSSSTSPAQTGCRAARPGIAGSAGRETTSPPPVEARTA